LGEEIYFPSFKLCPDFYNLLKTIFCAGKIQKNGYNEFPFTKSLLFPLESYPLRR
jgi:hypothetical protein